MHPKKKNTVHFTMMETETNQLNNKRKGYTSFDKILL